MWYNRKFKRHLYTGPFFFILTDMATTKLPQREHGKIHKADLPKYVICGHSDQLKASQTPKRRAVNKQLATSVSMSQPAQSSPELIPTDFRNQIKIFSCHQYFELFAMLYYHEDICQAQMNILKHCNHNFIYKKVKAIENTWLWLQRSQHHQGFCTGCCVVYPWDKNRKWLPPDLIYFGCLTLASLLNWGMDFQFMKLN